MNKDNYVNIDQEEDLPLEGLGMSASISAIRIEHIGCKRLLFSLRIAIRKGHQVLYGLSSCSESQSYFATIESCFLTFTNPENE